MGKGNLKQVRMGAIRVEPLTPDLGNGNPMERRGLPVKMNKRPRNGRGKRKGMGSGRNRTTVFNIAPETEGPVEEPRGIEHRRFESGEKIEVESEA